MGGIKIKADKWSLSWEILMVNWVGLSNIDVSLWREMGSGNDIESEWTTVLFFLFGCLKQTNVLKMFLENENKRTLLTTVFSVCFSKCEDGSRNKIFPNCLSNARFIIKVSN